jgi:hypothetical protein
VLFLCALLHSDPKMLTEIFGTIQVRDFHVAEDEKAIGFYAGECVDKQVVVKT